MNRRTKTLTSALTALSVGGVTAAVALAQPSPDQSSSAPDWHMAALYHHSDGWHDVGNRSSGWQPRAARKLPRSAGSPGTVRVGKGVPPPTNRWYSGMFFGATAQPVFAMPLALQAATDGLSVDLPDVSATSTTISGPFAPQFRVGLPTDGFRATRADPVSVTSTYTSSGQATGRLTIAEGWPYASYTAVHGQTVTLPASMTRRGSGRWLSTDVGGSTYGVAVTDRHGRPHAVSAPGGRLHLAAHQSLLVFAGPDLHTAAVLARNAVPITRATVRYRLHDGRAATAITYRTVGKRPTVMAAMPQRKVTGSGPVVGKVDSIYGTMALHRGRRLTTQVRALRPDATLDLSALDGDARDALRAQVEKDVNATVDGPAPPTDTYFGGKRLYRLAQLYRLAEAVGADDAAAKARTRVVGELDDWLADPSTCTPDQTKCFFYDTEFRGVVGRTASFGSEQFNDHHFHYGYFLAAAGLVGQGHPALLDRWRTTLTALAQDIASPVEDSMFPALRTFDPYAGHSWASGEAPFADGNNQESSSEAVNAWNGLALWARADKHPGLARQATWQLSLEAAAAKSLWLQPRHLPSGYDHPFVSLNWGGKREWATWFSAKPSAILGIQLIPMPAVYDQLRLSPARVRADLADATGGGYAVPFGDYLTLYLSLVEPDRALSIARDLPDSAIDDGDSRSYLLAWTLVHAARG
jgi:endoglucanase Acf2